MATKCLIVLGLLVVAAGAMSQSLPLVIHDGLEPADDFGRVVAVVGDVDADGVPDYAIGAPEADAGGDRRGRVHVYSGATHAELHEFEGTEEKERLGRAIDGAGDVDGDGHADIIVGEGVGELIESPRVQVFSGATGDVMLTFQGWVAGDDFGSGVAGLGDIDGDGLSDVGVGVKDHGCEAGDCIGRVLAYSGADGSVFMDVPGWTLHQRLGASLSGPGDLTGDGVPDLLVGSSGWKGNGTGIDGAVFVLSGADGSAVATLEGLPFELFGVGGDVGVTSGMLGDTNGDGVNDIWGGAEERLLVWSGLDATLLAIYEINGAPVAAPAGDLTGDGRDDVVLGEWNLSLARVRSSAGGETVWYASAGDFYDEFGASVARLGDFDGDGLPEILVGMPDFGFGPGRAMILELEAPPTPILVPGDGLSDTGFGDVVRAAGDVDNDGSIDVITGEPFDDSSFGNAGRARVFSGRDGTLLHDVLGTALFDSLGWSVAAAGDVDGDGFADFATGVPFRAPPLAGAVEIWSGRTGELLRHLDGHLAVDRFGLSVAGVGDVDGDGVVDLFVGAPYDDVLALDGGAAYLYSGDGGVEIAAFHGATASLVLGNSVGGGGDVDGDGVPDVLITVPNQPVGNPITFPGVVRVHSGATGALVHELVGHFSGDSFGSSAAIVGDLDLDGLDDIVVGSTGNGGRVDAFSGALGASLWLHDGADVGRTVAGAGDVDGDGRVDVLVGTPGKSLLISQCGSVQVLSGADGHPIASFAVELEKTKVGQAADLLGDGNFDGQRDVVGGADKAPDQPDGAVLIWPRESGTSPWNDLGAVLPGAEGVPRLMPSGSLLAGEPVGLALSGARPTAAVVLIAGSRAANLPVKGGTLVPAPDVVVTGLATDTAGELVLTAPWPAGVAMGTQLYLHFWIQDSVALKGWAASNAVRGLVP